MDKQKVLKKIQEKQIRVGVVGLGYVGLPLAVEKAKAGFKTTGFDVQQSKVDLVNAGHNYIGDVVQEDLETLVKEGMLKATSDFSFIKDLCSDSSGQASAARHLIRQGFYNSHQQASEEGYDGRPRVHNLSRYD